MQNINQVVITGRLTRDPELKALPSGSSVCSLRVAVSTRRKEDEEWVERPNYFDVIAWGSLGETVARYLTKGRQIAVSGRLDWREWETADLQRRQAVQIIADTIQFLESADREPEENPKPEETPQAA